MKRGYLIGLAVKNLTRYKRRTIITALVLAAGISIYILLDSLLIGSRNESETNLILYEMGDARLVTPAYWKEWKERPIDDCISNPDILLTELNEAGVKGIKRIEFSSTVVLTTGLGGSFPVTVTAMDSEVDGQVLKIVESLDEGRFPEKGEDAVVIGQWMAQDMEISMGDVLTLQLIDRWGARDAIELEITGLINSPNPEINRGGFYIPLDIANYYLDMEGAVTQLVLKLPFRRGERNRAIENIENLAAEQELEFHPWQDWSFDYLVMAAQDQYGSAVILFLVFVIASVGLANTMLMSVMERQREIGMMRSLGMNDKEVRRLFLIEASIIGVLGAFMGIIIAVLGNIPMVNRGIDFSSMMRDFSVGYRITGIMRGVWTITSYLYGLIAAIVICLAVAWLTVRKIMHRSITDEIRAA